MIKTFLTIPAPIIRTVQHLPDILDLTIILLLELVKIRQILETNHIINFSLLTIQIISKRVVLIFIFGNIAIILIESVDPVATTVAISIAVSKR